ncbi:uncharacterized protein LOC103713104 isoform X1 [Phoenix dactylifera]|uniref:Uncharacterized protein LOC103713104 isoform X1 n=1 Tax=Phoenix dactylifera TaxID=42345 RepID=A0A8B7CFG2_PHODC|nr:uncharacterized protein LOC103713104 isoform X1 [Phoenix dactylifera]XP_026662760.2 uncharacterized protein LOC103713104 isoform X1 [Phoenix dactylifera]
MGASKLLISLIIFSVVVVGVLADAGIEDEIAGTGATHAALRLELEQLRTKISALESSISDRTKELKGKDENTAQLERTVQEKSARIASLQSEIESLQKKGSVDAEELVGKVSARAVELEKQVEKLRNEIESQTRKSNALEAQAIGAEKKVQDLNLKLESLQKTNDEQKRRIQKTERALQLAEEELLRAQLEATARSKQLTEVHGAWLPPWLAYHISHFQELAATHWKERAKPVLVVFLQKASEKSAQAQKWAEPHLETAKTKWIPAIKEQWMIFVTHAEPYRQTVSTKTVEVYEASKTTITMHIVKIQELADPYYQEAKKLSKPYIDQVATVTKPHVEKVRVALNPHTKRVVQAYGKFLESATTYHRQAQAAVHEHLKKHELTKPLATKELVWFMASALLALPIFFLYRLLSDIFCPIMSCIAVRRQGNLHERPMQTLLTADLSAGMMIRKQQKINKKI